MNRKKPAKPVGPIAKRLAQIRGRQSQNSFAEELGVFQQNINRYHHGTIPHTNFLIALAKKKGVSIDWLLLGKGKQWL